MISRYIPCKHEFFGEFLSQNLRTGLPPAQTATATLNAACLDGPILHASSAPHFLGGCQQFHNDLCSGPPGVPDLVVEPPAILTADLRSIAGRLPEHQAALSRPVMATSNASPTDRIASRVRSHDALQKCSWMSY